MPKMPFLNVPVGTKFIYGNEYLEKVDEENVNAIPVKNRDGEEGYVFEPEDIVLVLATPEISN